MDRNKAIANEIISRCNKPIIIFTVIDMIMILLFFITLAIDISAITTLITLLVVIIFITYLLVYCKKVKKSPLKNRKYFYNLKSAPTLKYPFEYNQMGYFTSNLFGKKISVRCEGGNVSEVYVQKCKDFLNKIDENEKIVLVNLVLNDYKRFNKIVESVIELPMDDRILKYINPQIMWIFGDKKDNDEIEFLLECVCEWNKEEIEEIIVSCNKIKCIRQYTADLKV